MGMGKGEAIYWGGVTDAEEKMLKKSFSIQDGKGTLNEGPKGGRGKGKMMIRGGVRRGGGLKKNWRTSMDEDII